METRQLAYFLLACQQHNHLAAARELGIAASTLSENIARLEEELGLELFRLAPHGHYPTAEARALYQDFEHALRALEGIPGAIRGGPGKPGKSLIVRSELRFALGRISKAASLAARALRTEFPGVFFDIRFRAHDEPPAAGPVTNDFDLLIEYEGTTKRKNAIPLCKDPWLIVSNSSQWREARSIAVENLKELTLSLPDLPAQLHAAALRLCRQAGLPVPLSTNADIGALPRMSTSDDAFYLLVPQSILSTRLKHFKLHAARMPRSWTSELVAVLRTRHPPLVAYAEKLRRLLVSPERNSIYHPSLTMRQVRYFLALHEHGNVTVAARKLGVAQPALSSQLRGLEKTSRCSLFTRHRSGLTSTPEGDRLAGLFQNVVRRLDDAERKASRLATSHRHRMTLGVVPLAERGGVLVQSLIGAISEWRRAHADVELRIHEAPTDTLHKWVLSGSANIALVETIVPHSARLDLKSRDPLGVITAAGAGLLPTGDVRLEDLPKLPLILPSATFGMRQMIDEAAANAGVRLVSRAEVNSLVMAIALVAEGSSATIMPLGTVRRAVAAGELEFHQIVEPEIWRRLSIIYSADRSLSEIERAFIQTLRRHLSDSK